jgi:MFS family permease
MRALVVDVAPLRMSPAFRRLWAGSLVSGIGGTFTTFAAMYAVWHLTRSSVQVGLLGLVSAVPLVGMALLGTAFLDGVDRARLARRVTIGQIATAACLALAAHVGSVPAIILLTAAHASLGAVGGPARRSLVAGLVPTSQLSAAFALNGLAFQAAILIGPALAGVVTAGWNVSVCFLVDAVSFLAALVGLRGLTAVADASSARGLGAALEGLAFARRTPVVGGALLCDLAATVLAMPVALFPALYQQRFGGSPATLGLLTTALAVGGIAGSLLSGAVTRRSRPGVVMTACAATWGIALAAAGEATSLGVLLAMIALAGLADTWSVISRTTLVQTATPERLRGRISALEQVVGIGGPDLGGFRAGAVAAVIGPGAAMTLGGLTCLGAVGLITLTVPSLRTHHTSRRVPTDEGPADTSPA